jgi:UDP-glucose 4-epimerase
MRILVTGGAGFIGTNLIKSLIEIGHDVVSVDNYSTGNIENHQDGCIYHEWDLSSGDTYTFPNLAWRDQKYDLIYHLAALPRIQPSIINPMESIKNNFNSTLNILEYARKRNIQVVYAGSSSKHHGLYGSPYAWSKYGGEELCKLYSEVYDLNTVIFRFYNVYGPHQILEGTYATVVGIFKKQFENGESLTIVGDGEQRRDFTHVDDIVYGLTRCAGNKQHYKADEFELGSGVNYSINELAGMFGSKKTYIPERPGEYDKTLCDYSKAEKYLNYEPVMSLKEYITEFTTDNLTKKAFDNSKPKQKKEVTKNGDLNGKKPKQKKEATKKENHGVRRNKFTKKDKKLPTEIFGVGEDR